MKGNEYEDKDGQRQKDKIRKRYRGIAPEKIQIIPITISQPDFDDDSEPQRVAVYARVSTGDPRQTSSYELQKNYYESQVKNHPNWTLYEIYADEGLSGTSTEKRKEFNRMIEDCKAGKIDLIITKSISRFARNYVDCGRIVRELMNLNPPVGVRFESENLFTLKMQGEMQLLMFSGIAQEESRIKSYAMNASIEMRFGSGIFLTPPLLGYDQDEGGNLVVNEKEAKIVRLIFFLYLYGYTCQQIADALTQLGCRTKKGRTVWSASTISQVLRNERHCGAVKARKTFTPDYLDHKSRKNRGECRGYFVRDHHEPIIPPEDYFAVQKLLSNAKYGGRGILPQLHTVSEGDLRGFVAINPHWGGFSAENYRSASLDICESGEGRRPEQINAHPGDFDLRGFETVRAQFFPTFRVPCITVSANDIRFNQACIQKLGEARFIEMYVHPEKRVLAVRPTKEKTRHAVCWVRLDKNNQWMSRAVGGAAFIPVLYQLFEWRKEYKYCVRGLYCPDESPAILLFLMGDAEVLIPDAVFGANGQERFRSAARKSVVAFPSSWAQGFGDRCYIQSASRGYAAAEICNARHRTVSAEQERDFTVSGVIADSIRKLALEVQREGVAESE